VLLTRNRLVGVLAVVALCALPSAAGAEPKARGTFETLPDGAAMGLEIEGFAQLVRGESGTQGRVVVRGLDPGTTYAAHLHNAPCSAANPGGAHYRDDPAGPSAPPNELWFSSTEDPQAGVTANAGGVAHGRGAADWVARPEAQSVVIHAIPPGGNTAGGPKIACADLASSGGGSL
jgi:hypothetical protein